VLRSRKAEKQNAKAQLLLDASFFSKSQMLGSIFLDAAANARRENLGGDAGGVRSSGAPGATMQRGRAAPRQLRANKQIDK
jgi:hypothetical protein